jgi:hypothetical protein
MGQGVANGAGAFAPALLLKPGTRLLREWGGMTHTVIVLDDGFEYDGERHVCFNLSGQRAQPALYRRRESAMGPLLHLVGDLPDHQITARRRGRLTAGGGRAESGIRGPALNATRWLLNAISRFSVYLPARLEAEQEAHTATRHPNSAGLRSSTLRSRSTRLERSTG